MELKAPEKYTLVYWNIFIAFQIQEHRNRCRHFKELTALIPHITVVLPCFTNADPSAVVIDPRNYICGHFADLIDFSPV